MVYLGCDQHKHYCVMTKLDTDSKELETNKFYHNSPEVLKEYLGQLPSGTGVAIEACGYEAWLCDLMESCGMNVHLGHPLKTKAIAEAKIKTDKIDSTILAQLLAADLLPEAYLPPEPIRQKRALLRYRQCLVQWQTQTKNRIHFLLDRLGIRPPELTDLFGVDGRRWLKELSLKGNYQRILEGNLEIIDFVQAKIKILTKEIEVQLAEDTRAELLESVPGIGKLSAFLLLAEMGPIDRFPSSEHLCSYAGLVPSIYQSGKKLYHGSITKQGNKFIRWIMVEAAQRSIRKDEFLRNFYIRLKTKKGHSVAIVAVARKLLVSIFYVLQKNQKYRFRSVTVRRSSVTPCSV